MIELPQDKAELEQLIKDTEKDLLDMKGQCKDKVYFEALAELAEIRFEYRQRYGVKELKPRNRKQIYGMNRAPGMSFMLAWRLWG